MLSVLLISIDTLRSDHLGCYGYPRLTSPNLDRLAREAALFESAWAPAAYTVPSFTSLMTSRWPSWHTAGFSNMPRRALTPEMVPLAELMAEEGYQTAAFVSTLVLSRRSCGLDRGFELYDDETRVPELNRAEFLYRPARDTARAALGWLEAKAGRPFFLWVHFMDVHGPYNPPPAYASRFQADDRPLTPFDRLHLPLIPDPRWTRTAPPDFRPGIPAYQVLGLTPPSEAGQAPGFASAFRHYLDRYDGAISYVDLACGRLLSLLRKLGRLEETIVIVHSDHGEALGEGGVFFFHGLTVTRDQIQVPLIIRAPQLKPGRYSEPVSLGDVTPFLIEALGLREPAGLMGRSLLDPPDPTRLIPAQVLRQLALVRGGDLFLFGRGFFEPAERGTLFDNPSGREVLDRVLPPQRFDYRADPLGCRPLEPSPDSAEISDWAARFVEAANGQRFPVLSLAPGPREAAEVAEKMRRLGYLD